MTEQCQKCLSFKYVLQFRVMMRQAIPFLSLVLPLDLQLNELFARKIPVQRFAEELGMKFAERGLS